ncbi:oxidoreductase [Adhaeribacter arboris]|uniref:Oxidoreductase n=1 Tax=Adhaeribacter arboris TaxID=2072846 RepID=A0A2T2YF07_9BACT|nr:Gfo/Idh/MocA family oxidoreductase [Adhaeribacter arboris]PSR54048.1 oxidoreductase [Adhaeribacter arboris]
MENKPYRILLLGTGLIGNFYAMSLHGQRKLDRIHTVYSRSEERAQKFAAQWDIPHYETDLAQAIQSPETDVVVIGLPNNLHLEAVRLAAEAGKGILCTKPLGRNAAEAMEMLKIVEEAGVFHGYLEDLAYPAKTLKALTSIKNGALGKVLWTRSREAHPGPHSDWFWNAELSGGGAIIDMGCHCIEIGRNYIGKDIRPVEVMCWADTLVKPIEAEDNAIGLVKYANGAMSQFEVSWTYRGGMDLRDEVSGTEGTLRVDHFLRTGLEMFTSIGEQGYVAEKAESETGWLFPVGDESHALGYPQMFDDMFTALDKGTSPMETFYDGYVVNAIMDACYKSARTKKWEPVELEVWRGNEVEEKQQNYIEYDYNHYLIKEELLPDGRKKLILKEKAGGQVVQRVLD